MTTQTTCRCSRLSFPHRQEWRCIDFQVVDELRAEFQSALGRDQERSELAQRCESERSEYLNERRGE